MRTNHRCIVIKRLVVNRLELGNNMVGNIIISVIIGSPIRVGVRKGANRFSFILTLRGYYVVVM